MLSSSSDTAAHGLIVDVGRNAKAKDQAHHAKQSQLKRSADHVWRGFGVEFEPNILF
ncbi:hypothetical protein VCRA2130O400_360044 [Vibrio crassostreae]|nr:hypothetical protein VCRA2130O400_360044 [Vibrio crassostreae]